MLKTSSLNMDDPMEIDNTIGTSPIRVRYYSINPLTGAWQWFSEHIIKYKEQKNEEAFKFLKRLLNSKALQSNIDKVLEWPHKDHANSSTHRTTQKNSVIPKIEIKAEFIPDIASIEDDDTGNESQSPISKTEPELWTEFWEPPQFEIGETYFIPRLDDSVASWVKAKLMKILSDCSDQCLYEMTEIRTKKIRIIDDKRIAFKDPPKAILKVGSRVIAIQRKFADTGEVRNGRQVYCLGIVAEIPSLENQSRYLIIFDNGHWLYVRPTVVRPIFKNFIHVWRDVPSSSRREIKNYLMNIEKPMVTAAQGGLIWVLISDIWTVCDVIAVDASLLLIYCRLVRKIEWIYRGSPRLRLLTDKDLCERALMAF